MLFIIRNGLKPTDDVDDVKWKETLERRERESRKVSSLLIVVTGISLCSQG